MENISHYFKNLKIICTLCFMAVCVLLSGCGSKKNTVSMYDLSKAMLASDHTLPDMTTVSSSDTDAEDNFGYLSDMDYSKVDGYFLSYSTEGKADEIAVIAVKDTSDIADAKKSLESHVESRKSVYSTYDPTQLDRVEKAEVFTQDQYAVLIISDGSSNIKNAFMSFLTDEK